MNYFDLVYILLWLPQPKSLEWLYKWQMVGSQSKLSLLHRIYNMCDVCRCPLYSSRFSLYNDRTKMFLDFNIPKSYFIYITYTLDYIYYSTQLQWVAEHAYVYVYTFSYKTRTRDKCVLRILGLDTFAPHLIIILYHFATLRYNNTRQCQQYFISI